MNTTAQALVFAVASVAAAAALGVGLADRTAPVAQQQVVKLERVVIEGRRVHDEVVIAKLPTVVIEGRRTLPADAVQVAEAAPAARAL